MIQISASLLLFVLVMFTQKAHPQELARFKIVFDNDLANSMLSRPQQLSIWNKLYRSIADGSI